LLITIDEFNIIEKNIELANEYLRLSDNLTDFIQRNLKENIDKTDLSSFGLKETSDV
jgi:hypothetical protein